MSPIQVAGIALSGLALVALLVPLVELVLRRRLALLGWRLGGWRGGLVRAALALAGILGFAAGGHGPALASDRSARPSAGLAARAVTTTWRFPFYVQTRTRHLTAEGKPLGEEAVHALQLPWAFLLWLSCYAGVIRRPASDRLNGRSRPGDAVPRAPAGSR